MKALAVAILIASSVIGVGLVTAQELGLSDPNRITRYSGDNPPYHEAQPCPSPQPAPHPIHNQPLEKIQVSSIQFTSMHAELTQRLAVALASAGTHHSQDYIDTTSFNLAMIILEDHYVIKP